MKSKVFLLVLSLIITISTVAGATYAWFTDTETSMGNTFTAGTVDISIDRDMGDATPGPMFYITNAEGSTPDGIEGMWETGLWMPGKSVTRQLDVRNIGTLQVRLNELKADISSINGADPASSPELTALANSFAQNMNVKVYVAGHEDDMLMYNGTLADLLTTKTCITKPPIQALRPGQHPSVMQLCFKVTMSESAGNDLQGIRPVVSFWVGAEQTKNNP